jgi:CDP-3, 6-dideoxy-D-glycero-L-glycero-4-hexulose-4-reductase
LRLLLDCLETDEEPQMWPRDQILDLAHVDDICEAFLHSAKLVRDPEHPSIASYAVSGGERMALREIVATQEKAAGRTLKTLLRERPL